MSLKATDSENFSGLIQLPVTHHLSNCFVLRTFCWKWQITTADLCWHTLADDKSASCRRYPITHTLLWSEGMNRFVGHVHCSELPDGRCAIIVVFLLYTCGPARSGWKPYCVPDERDSFWSRAKEHDLCHIRSENPSNSHIEARTLPCMRATPKSELINHRVLKSPVPDASWVRLV